MRNGIKVGRWLEVGHEAGGNVVLLTSDVPDAYAGKIAVERADVPDLIRALIKLQDPAHRVEFVEAK